MFYILLRNYMYKAVDFSCLDYDDTHIPLQCTFKKVLFLQCQLPGVDFYNCQYTNLNRLVENIFDGALTVHKTVKLNGLSVCVRSLFCLFKIRHEMLTLCV